MLMLIAAAAAAAQAPAIDPARMAAATALVQQIGIREQIQAEMNRNIAAMKQGAAIRAMLAPQPGFAQAYQANKAKFDAAFVKAGGIQAEIAQKAVNENLGAVVNEAAKAYARAYTTEELTQLAAFYRSPLGQAVTRNQGRVMAEIGQATGRIIGAKIDAGMKANAARLNAALAPLTGGAPPPRK